MKAPKANTATQGPQDINAILTACESLWRIETKQGTEGEDWETLKDAGTRRYPQALQEASKVREYILTHESNATQVRIRPQTDSETPTRAERSTP